jgi:hypothetical protein
MSCRSFGRFPNKIGDRPGFGRLLGLWRAASDIARGCRSIGRFRWLLRHAMLPCMDDQGSDDDQVEQRMKAMLLRLLKTPPQPRAELAAHVRRAKGQPTRVRGRRASVRKPC